MSSPLSTPDGLLRVEFESAERPFRTAQLSGRPRVIHIPSDRVVFDRFGSPWQATASIDPSGRLTLRMRPELSDPKAAPHTLVFDPATDQCLQYEQGPPSGTPTTTWHLNLHTEVKPPIEGASSTVRQSSAAPPADLELPSTPSPDSSIFIEITPDMARGSRFGRRVPHVKPEDVIPPLNLPPVRPPRHVHPLLTMLGFAAVSIIAAACVFGIAWILATRTPLHKMPAWAGWGVSMFGASLVTWIAASALSAIKLARRPSKH